MADFSGEKNPNFGKRWTEEQKQRQSVLVKQRMANDEVRQKVGSANRGKKFSEERICRMHGHRTRDSYRHYPSDIVRAKIGNKSKEKFTPEYLEKVRKKNYASGVWIDPSTKPDWEIYKKESNWKERMYDILGCFDVWHYKNNKNGLVRDHIFSRWEGFCFKVFPELLRHPANCQLLRHGDNVRKMFAERRQLLSDPHRIELLFENILHYDKEWNEQELCCQFINRYRNGERWKNKHRGEPSEERDL